MNIVAFFSGVRFQPWILRWISNFNLIHNELWKLFHEKAIQENCLQNKKNFILTQQRLIGTLSRMSVFIEFFINTISFIYIPPTSWDFSYFIL